MNHMEMDPMATTTMIAIIAQEAMAEASVAEDAKHASRFSVFYFHFY